MSSTLEHPRIGEKTWCVGTLTYNKSQLVNVFIWMLWGDFCLFLMDSGVGRTLVPLQLKKFGASNTLMLAGKGVKPSDYGNSAALDGGACSDCLTWAYPSIPLADPTNPKSDSTWNYQHTRMAWGMVQDTDKPWPVGTGIDWIGTTSLRHSSMARSMGSPHPGGMPCLWGDASVRTVSYSVPNLLCSQLWFYNDGVTSSDY